MDKTFSENMRKARIKAGLTQEFVADKIGVATSTYSLYEKGTREPNVLRIKQIADALGVTGDELLGIGRNDTFVTARLTSWEEKCLDKYRALPQNFQRIIDELINALYKEVTS